MIRESELVELLIFDLETAPGEGSLEELRKKNPRKAALWETKHEKASAKDPDKWCKSPDHTYMENAALSPDFGRIVCASFLHIVEDQSGGTVVYRGRLKSFYDNKASDNSEKEILEAVATMLSNVKKTGKVYKLCGHNIKKFDIPFLAKRMIMHNVPVPMYLQVWGKKPWELDSVDTGDLWSMGSWDQYISLDLLCCSLGIVSPKENMKGEYVGKAFWQEKRYDEIAKYCEEDIKAVARVCHKLSGSEYQIFIE